MSRYFPISSPLISTFKQNTKSLPLIISLILLLSVLSISYVLGNFIYAFAVTFNILGASYYSPPFYIPIFACFYFGAICHFTTYSIIKGDLTATIITPMNISYLVFPTIIGMLDLTFFSAPFWFLMSSVLMLTYAFSSILFERSESRLPEDKRIMRNGWVFDNGIRLSFFRSLLSITLINLASIPSILSETGPYAFDIFGKDHTESSKG